MSIFVYTESDKNGFTAESLEAISFAKKWASQQNKELIALCINAKTPEFLKKFGANKIIAIKSESLKTFNPQCFAQILEQYIDGLTIFPHTAESIAIAGSLSVLKGFPIITQISEFPEQLSLLALKRNIFSGKAHMSVYPETEQLILTLIPKFFGIKENPTESTIENIEIELKNPFSLLEKEEKKNSKDLTTANIVVCAGRGLKAPENWKMIEELAQVLDATTACTRPISDMGWRDYNEHAGQTGKNIAPQLYIGIGVSGATQHIAGINGSKTIVVINNDPNADFFKYADYGIIGDAFQIVPALTEKIRKINEQ